MRCFLTTLAGTALLIGPFGFCSLSCGADAQQPPTDRRAPSGVVAEFYRIPKPVQPPPATPAPSPPPQPPRQPEQHRGHSHWAGLDPYWDWYYAPGYSYAPYVYGPYGGPFFYSPTIPLGPWLGGVTGSYLGPSYLGPAAPTPLPAAPRIDLRRDREADESNEKPPRGSSGSSVAVAKKFLEYGDARFRAKQYAFAYGRYKRAAETAPGLADGFFREGFARIATGQYDLAAKAFQRGLEIDPKWVHSGFSLDRLYGENQPEKTAHLERLAAAANREPQRGELLFLVGLFLYFDGQPERAAPFFERAIQRGAIDSASVREFLPSKPDPGADLPAQAPGPW